MNVSCPANRLPVAKTWVSVKSGVIHTISFWIKQLLASDIKPKLLKWGLQHYLFASGL